MDRGEENVEVMKVIISLFSHLVKVVKGAIPEGKMKIKLTTKAQKDSFKEFGEKKADRRGKSKMGERKRFRDMPERCESMKQEWR